MTRVFVCTCALLLLLIGPLAAQQISPDCAQPIGTDVKPASVGEDHLISKPCASTAQPDLPFPPSFDRGWLATLFRLGTTTPQPQPDWFPLDPKAQKWVDELLAEWEAANSQIERFECGFQRWQFDPVFGPKDGNTPRSYTTGVIKYQKPDKAVWRVDTMKNYAAPARAGDKPSYVMPKDGFREHWVCDGKSIFEFDYRRKALIERSLPAKMQGKPIGDGRIPFLFGRSAAAIKERYWIRPLSPPAGVENDYWLELWPRNSADAAALKFIKVVIAQSDMRLAALSGVPPNYDAKRNPARVDYRFTDRRIVRRGADPWRFLESDFFEPRTPLGWKKEVQILGSPAPIPGAK